MGGAHRATAIGFVSAFSRLQVHPANTKANNRAMILIRAIPFCQVSKQERRREWNAIIGIGGWKYDPRENREAPDRAFPLGASGGGDRLRAECAQAGFCHEDLFMSDSARVALFTDPQLSFQGQPGAPKRLTLSFLLGLNWRLQRSIQDQIANR